MVYNKTKAGLEKGATITGIVVSAIQLVGAFVMFVLGCAYIGYDTYYFDGYGYTYVNLYTWAVPVLVVGILLLVLCTITLVFNCILVKSPVNPDGTIKNRQGLRITLVVFSFLVGQWITFGLEIAVLCLKDFVDENATAVAPVAQPASAQPAPVAAQPAPVAKKTVAQPAVQPVAQTTTKDVASMSVEEKIAELKHFKELGIIDETAYNKAIGKIIDDLK